MGHVGAHVAYALAVQGIADELILIDKNAQKLASEIQDLRDAAAYLPHRVSFQAGEFSDLGECDVIVNCVGKIEFLRESHDRTTEMDFTIPAVRGFAEKIKKSGFNGVVINITNPCDIVTHELALGLGLPKGRVFGTGTGLDTARLLSALARQTGIDHKSITCYMLGEHGNKQFAPWSCVSFRGMPLDVWAKTDERFRFDREALQKRIHRRRMGHILRKILHRIRHCDDRRAHGAHRSARQRPLCLPARALRRNTANPGCLPEYPVCSANGVEQIVELPLTAEEQAQFHACCDGIRANMEHWKNIRNI